MSFSVSIKQCFKSDYRLALDQYREIKAQQTKALEALRTCYNAISIGVIHGRKEQSMINRIKQLNGALFDVSVKLAKAEAKLNREAKRKDNK